MTADTNEYVPLERLFDKTNSIYKLVILASKRASELNNGQPKLIESPDGEDISKTALREIMEGKVICETKEKKAAGRGKEK